ncbi:MAG: hypothetical protein HXO83_13895, partial [Selenomonas sp.]|nr:hypothetical protein [Selenomonas sp.]
MKQFQSTRPVRGATEHKELCSSAATVSIHAPRVGRDGTRNGCAARDDVSIHAPRVGRDVLPSVPPRPVRRFNSRAPCGARLCAASSSFAFSEFQSTRPVRGATDHLVAP